MPGRADGCATTSPDFCPHRQAGLDAGPHKDGETDTHQRAAISVPDPTFEAASRRAHELGISRSEFVASAADHCIAELDAASVAAPLVAALDAATDDETTTATVGAGKRTLQATEW